MPPKGGTAKAQPIEVLYESALTPSLRRVGRGRTTSVSSDFDNDTTSLDRLVIASSKYAKEVSREFNYIGPVKIKSHKPRLAAMALIPDALFWAAAAGFGLIVR